MVNHSLIIYKGALLVDVLDCRNTTFPSHSVKSPKPFASKVESRSTSLIGSPIEPQTTRLVLFPSVDTRNADHWFLYENFPALNWDTGLFLELEAKLTVI
jgi:hypothetical protein